MFLIAPTKTISVKLRKNYDPFSKVFIQIAPLHSCTESLSFFKPKNQPLKFRTNLPKKQNFQFQCSSANSSQFHVPFNSPTLIKALILFTFSLSLLFLRLISNIFLPDFPQRWHALLAFSSQAEAKLISQNYPQHLLQVVVAYEDRRFFCHFGVDPVGIARAILSFSTRGGGSTITQQVLNMFDNMSE